MAQLPNLQLGGEPPEESLRTVRRAVVGRWWLQVKPLLGGGFQAQAHTLRGDAGVWAGEVRDSLAQATADAIEVVGYLRQHG
jgi:hypothetical protein